jgi:hypothetical protein
MRAGGAGGKTLEVPTQAVVIAGLRWWFCQKDGHKKAQKSQKGERGNWALLASAVLSEMRDAMRCGAKFVIAERGWVR